MHRAAVEVSRYRLLCCVPRPGQKRPKGMESEGEATWVKKGPRQAGRAALFAAAVSSDSKFLAVGGGDRQVGV